MLLYLLFAGDGAPPQRRPAPRPPGRDVTSAKTGNEVRDLMALVKAVEETATTDATFSKRYEIVRSWYMATKGKRRPFTYGDLIRLRFCHMETDDHKTCSELDELIHKAADYQSEQN